ncbi:MAG: hypothetical protein MI976_24600 [Pseudomonadales bacterium]|nr:hypothetical protein [Pseudomonadales bacterium]
MSVEILHGNLLDKKAEAVILTVDGASAGLEGNITRAFGRAYPDAWEELEYLVKYPIPLGTAKIYPIATDLDCPFRFALFASTLHHIETLTDSEKIDVMRTALNSSLLLATSKLLGTLSCGLMSGGWRLGVEETLEAMLNTYSVYASGRDNVVDLNIYLLSNKEFNVVSSYISTNYMDAIAVEHGYRLKFA